MSKQVDWTEDKKQFILEHYYLTPHKTLTELFNKEFGINVPVTTIRSYLKRHHLVNGLSGKFYKGQPSNNKGKKMSPEIYEKVKHTFFKKGTVPPKKVPVGTEVLRDDGYLKVKIAEPNVWKQKHRLVWEENYGKVPKGMKVMFLDGDKTNCEISNLKLISKQASLIMNRNDMNYDNALLNDVASNTAELMAKRFELKNKKKEVC